MPSPVRLPPAPRRLAAAVVLLSVATGCSPALDWREARLDGGALLALFPCKPVELTREATLLGQRVRMSLQSCSADGATFAVTHADVGDPARVAPALAGLRQALADNLGAATGGAAAPFGVAGMTPNDQAVRLRLRGSLPGGGGSVEEEAVFFAKGTRVYQAVVLAQRARVEAADAFFASLRLPA